MRPLLVLVWWTVYLCGVGSGLARGAFPDGLAPKPKSADPVAEALKREADAKSRERAAAFARILAFQPPPPAEMDEVMVSQVVIAGNQIVIVDEIRQRERPAPPVDDDLDGETPPEPGFLVGDEVFDHWVFGAYRDEPTFRARMAERLDRYFRDDPQIETMTPSQKARMRLAARGDMRRVLDQVNVARQRFQAVKTDRVGFGNLMLSLDALKTTIESVFSARESVFLRARVKILRENTAVGLRD